MWPTTVHLAITIERSFDDRENFFTFMQGNLTKRGTLNTDDLLVLTSLDRLLLI
jgi:hypothetical protein